MPTLPQTSEPPSFWALARFSAFTRPLRSAALCVRVNCRVGEMLLLICAMTRIREMAV